MLGWAQSYIFGISVSSIKQEPNKIHNNNNNNYEKGEESQKKASFFNSKMNY